MPTYYISGRGTGEELFYVSSPTQGERMIPFAYSMAYTFRNKGVALRTKLRLKEMFKGLILSVRKYSPDNSDSYAFGPSNSDY